MYQDVSRFEPDVQTPEADEADVCVCLKGTSAEYGLVKDTKISHASSSLPSYLLNISARCGDRPYHGVIRTFIGVPVSCRHFLIF